MFTFIRILIFFCFLQGFLTQAAAFELPLAGSIRGIGQAVDLLEDPDGHLGLEALLALSEDHWRHNPHDTLALGYSTSVWWVRLQLTHPASNMLHHVLELGVPSIDFVDAYIFHGSSIHSEVHTGDQRPFNTRPIHTPLFAFPLETAPDVPTIVILRLAMIDGVFDRVPVNLWGKDDYAQIHPWRTLIAGAYYGAIVILLAYNLLLFISTREKSFFYYVIYLGLFLLWNVGYLGFGYQYFWPDHSFWNNQVNYTLVLLVHLAATLFVCQYLELSRRCPFLYRMLWTLNLLLLLPSLIQIGDTLGWVVPRVFSVSLFVILSSLLTLGYLLSGAYLWWKGVTAARFFTLAWSFLVLSILFYQMAAMPGMSVASSSFSDYCMNIGSLMEFLLLALAMGDRFNRLREEKLAVERNARLREEAHASELERQVHMRTRELSEAMEQVTAALQIERGSREEQQIFLTTVSHELRTPLAVIDAIAQNLQSSATGVDDKTRARYQRILQATGRMAGLLEQYLQEDHLDSISLALRRCPTDIRALLEDAMNAAMILSDSHSFSIDVEGLPATFSTDAHSMKLVLRILGDNAVKHTPPGTHVCFIGRATGHGITVSVVDNGPGIPPELQARIFEPFYRGGTSSASSGHGLGLSLARRMVSLQGGYLSVSSAGHGGCSFNIDLPLN
ncbi:MAG: hypothetical protein RIQ52_678 [Pseudomonadota bacterium]